MPDLAGVPSEWRSLLGGDYEAVARFLLPTKRIAGSVRCTAPGWTCIHEIRKFRGEYLEVCPDGCKPTTRSRDEVVVHRLDVVGFAREIAESLDLEALPAEAVPNMAGVWRIGEFAPSAGYRYAVCLAFTGEPDVLRSVVDGMAARGEPFVLIAPTRSAFGHAAADLLKRTGSLFLSLDELIGDGDGRLSLLDGHSAAGVFAEFRAAHVPEPEAEDGTAFFPTPAGARWEHVSIRFIDRHSVYINVQGVTGKYHCAQMGMARKNNAKPTVQWDLLEAFAEGHGRLDWRNSKASRKNQKRKENLAADLQRFFRIDGDPFALEGDGWRARFAVAIRE
ncbi:MAG TPA: hypothetical protein DCX07_09810 [Phycisphaerales bacterium]|nr:hypothetical protein [Phycisphaerales bacterium]